MWHPLESTAVVSCFVYIDFYGRLTIIQQTEWGSRPNKGRIPWPRGGGISHRTAIDSTPCPLAAAPFVIFPGEPRDVPSCGGSVWGSRTGSGAGMWPAEKSSVENHRRALRTAMDGWVSGRVGVNVHAPPLPGHGCAISGARRTAAMPP